MYALTLVDTSNAVRGKMGSGSSFDFDDGLV
jgi:hypothetical protein